ncbi:hypothetical protein C8F04DRAFT_1272618 [Mycena alexandri]|uniref:Uncharacterized protein n=1 Tax=Mycena alexandri TaxID=1745969 RepID=A0AAD6S8T2_9AGAR|nr:hypothetical protein C8F04DRAFT_1272618 [Mycena alexandri]
MGSATGGQFDIRSAHSKGTKTVDFTKWDPHRRRRRDDSASNWCWSGSGSDVGVPNAASGSGGTGGGVGDAEAGSGSGDAPAASPVGDTQPPATPPPQALERRRCSAPPASTPKAVDNGSDDPMDNGGGDGGERGGDDDIGDEEVAALSGEARRARIWELSRAGSYEKRRSPPVGRGDAGRYETQEHTGGGGKKGKKRARKDDDEFEEGEEDDNGGDESGDDNNEGAEREGTPTPQPRMTRSGGGAEREGTPTPQPRTTRSGGGGAEGRARAKGGESQNALIDGVAKWAVDGRKTLLEGSGGAAWENMVETWWKHEKLASFEGPAKGLLPSRRPAQVTTWIGQGREGEPNPDC